MNLPTLHHSLTVNDIMYEYVWWQSAPGNKVSDCLFPHLHYTTTWNNKACLIYLLRLGWLHNLGLFNKALPYSHVCLTCEAPTDGNWALGVWVQVHWDANQTPWSNCFFLCVGRAGSHMKYMNINKTTQRFHQNLTTRWKDHTKADF